MAISRDQVPVEHIEKERTIFAAQAAESGKPPEIVAKMVDGAIDKFLAEVTLLGQPFVKDTEQTVEKYVKAKGATVNSFHLFVVGEGSRRKRMTLPPRSRQWPRPKAFFTGAESLMNTPTIAPLAAVTALPTLQAGVQTSPAQAVGRGADGR